MAGLSVVLEYRLDCEPTGDFLKGKFGGLESVKFHCLLGKPDGTPFAEDLERLSRTLVRFRGTLR